MSASDRPLGDLIEEIEEGKLIVRPGFQRRLVWTNRDKEYFIETVLKGLPFPEIFICSGEKDKKRSTRNKWLVDGQQRMTTLRDYFAGSTNILYKTIKRYADLTQEEHEDFLETRVAVRDLQRVTEEQLKNIFTRINSTNYVLRSMEKRNALFSGEFKQYCDALSTQPFFQTHKVFSAGRTKRMEDLAFCVILVTTVLAGYFHRDNKNAEFLERYNDDFPDQERIQAELDAVFSFIDDCGFDKSSEVWKLTNLFTLIVELHQALVVQNLKPSVSDLGSAISAFYIEVKNLNKSDGPPPEDQGDDIFRYWKASKTAANDKHSRVRRAEIIAQLISKFCVSDVTDVQNRNSTVSPKKKSKSVTATANAGTKKKPTTKKKSDKKKPNKKKN